jgi:precorrin-8X/cobalt-precorrin-8 methylmutase
MTEIIKIAPMEIERESFRIITEELGDRVLDPEQAPIIKRVIHTTADFDYADNLYFSPDAVRLAKDALKGGATVVTDTQMALAGIGHRMADEETSQKLWNLLSRPIPHRIASGHVL